MPHLISTPELAAQLGLAEITLRKWRVYGSGPRFVRLGGSVRYRAEDIDAWLASRVANSTSENPSNGSAVSQSQQAGGGSANV
jgi:predicted DNA-binding transcriptional regulator AlpA